MAHPLREQLVSLALRHVPQLGWCDEAIRRAAKELGYSPALSSSITPIQLVHHHMRSLNSIALNDLSKRHDIADLRVSAILKAGIRKRLELQTPVLVVWPEAMAMGAMPQNALGTARVIEELCDGLWGIAGRQGPDLTQKAALGVVYAATEVHMLADSSHEYRNTWEFLDKRIADMMALGSVPSELERILKSGIGTLLGSIRFGDQIVGTRSNLKDKQ